MNTYVKRSGKYIQTKQRRVKALVTLTLTLSYSYSRIIITKINGAAFTPQIYFQAMISNLNLLGKK